MPTGLDHVRKEDTEAGPELEGDSWQILVWGQRGMMADADWRGFVNAAVRLARKSTDYRRYVDWLAGDRGMGRCSVLGNVPREGAAVEMHHYPFSLHRICSAEASRLLAEPSGADTFAVAEAVLEAHYANEVGLVPLSTTVHEMAHRGRIFVDLRQVFGRYDLWLERRLEFFARPELFKLREIVRRTRESAPASEEEGFLQWINPEAARRGGGLPSPERLEELARG